MAFCLFFIAISKYVYTKKNITINHQYWKFDLKCPWVSFVEKHQKLTFPVKTHQNFLRDFLQFLSKKILSSVLYSNTKLRNFGKSKKRNSKENILNICNIYFAKSFELIWKFLVSMRRIKIQNSVYSIHKNNSQKHCTHHYFKSGGARFRRTLSRLFFSL